MSLLAPSISLPRVSVVCSDTSPMRDVIRACQRIAPSHATALITGETGTGKEVIARVIHEYSNAAGRPFVPVNCGAIPEALIESELFGHVKGAFTGAQGSRKGRIALAEGGTLFLDEIGELPLSLQVKLLRVLQERVYEPIGSSESVTANFRLIAATNRHLASEVQAERFRRDLYYRLMVCPIELPPLRERRDDIVELIRHFWSQRGETRLIDDEAMQILRAYDWPGNVRELENLVERLSVCCEGPEVRAGDLPRAIRERSELPAAHRSSSEATVASENEVRVRTLPMSEVLPETAVAAHNSDFHIPDLDQELTLPIELPAFLRRIEDKLIDAALSQTHGNKRAAADMLGLQRTTLVEKLRRRQKESVETKPPEGSSDSLS